MKKVLIVDDTKNIRMILTKCLELEGYEVMSASDGKQALQLFMTHNFHLAFLDIKLPEIRGTEVLKRIRELGIKTPVIIITAYATVKNAVDCTNLGAVAYVQKPFSADKIRSVLKEFDDNYIDSEKEKTNIQGIINSIKLALSNEEYNRALDLAKKALSLEFNIPEVYLLISQAYAGLKDTDNSQRFHKVFELFEA